MKKSPAESTPHAPPTTADTLTRVLRDTVLTAIKGGKLTVPNDDQQRGTAP